MQNKTALFTEKQAAEYLGLAVATLQQRRHKGRMPRYFKIGKTVRYSIEDLDAFLESCRVEPTEAA